MSRLDFRRAALALGVLAAAFALIACSDSEEDEGTPTTTATAGATTAATDVPTGDAPHNVDGAACDEIVAQVPPAVGGGALIVDSTGYSAGGGALTGEGCRLMMRGTAAEMPSYTEVALALRGVLEANGWAETPQYQADGPTSTMSVFGNEAGDVAVLAAGVSPADPTACPQDQVISECLEALDPAELIVQGEIILDVES